jgi:hypothetical protein
MAGLNVWDRGLNAPRTRVYHTFRSVGSAIAVWPSSVRLEVEPHGGTALIEGLKVSVTAATVVDDSDQGAVWRGLLQL